MVVRASGFGIGVLRFSRPLRGVGVQAMLDGRLDTMQHIESVCEVLPSADVLQLLRAGMEVAVIIERHCVVDVVAITP
jgi:hypothetical protein